MKFPEINKLKEDTLNIQYEKVYDGIINRKHLGHSTYKCDLDLKPEILKQLQEQEYCVTATLYGYLISW